MDEFRQPVRHAANAAVCCCGPGWTVAQQALSSMQRRANAGSATLSRV